MGDAFYREDGSTFYGGKGRRPGNFWDEANALKLFKKDAEGKLYRYDPAAEDKQIELEIQAYIAELQNNTRSNCSTCKHFSIPRANWPHKKRQGLCTARENMEVGKTDLCKQFCRPGEVTEAEAFDNLDKKTKTKIRKKEQQQNKRYQAILKKFQQDDNITKESKKRVASLNSRLKGDMAEAMAIALEKRYARETTSPQKASAKAQQAIKAREENRKAAAKFLGVAYMNKAKVFKKDKTKLGSIAAMAKWLRENKDMKVKAEFVWGKGWKLTNGDKVFGPKVI